MSPGSLFRHLRFLSPLFTSCSTSCPHECWITVCKDSLPFPTHSKPHARSLVCSSPNNLHMFITYPYPHLIIYPYPTLYHLPYILSALSTQCFVTSMPFPFLRFCCIVGLSDVPLTTLFHFYGFTQLSDLSFKAVFHWIFLLYFPSLLLLLSFSLPTFWTPVSFYLHIVVTLRVF